MSSEPPYIAERFRFAAAGDVTLACALLANGLMRGDAASFKAGYSRESAMLAALEVFPDALEGDALALLAVFEAFRNGRQMDHVPPLRSGGRDPMRERFPTE